MPSQFSFTKIITDFLKEQNRNKRARLKKETEELKLEQTRTRTKQRTSPKPKQQKGQTGKSAKQINYEARIKEAETKNAQLSKRMEELSSIMECTLTTQHIIPFKRLQKDDRFHEFVIPDSLQDKLVAPILEAFLENIKAPGVLEKLIPGVQKRYEKAMQLAHADYQTSVQKYETELAEREATIKRLSAEHENTKKAFELEIQKCNQEIEELERAYYEADSPAVRKYCAMVLERSKYPTGFPRSFRVAYVRDPKELVIEYELPPVGIVPNITEYRYNKTKDVIDEKPRKIIHVKELYQDIISSICIRTIYEVLQSDQGNHIQVIVFNGLVQAVDPSTGQDIRPCLITVRTTRDKFNGINLHKIDKRACLHHLGAQISPHPDEKLPIKPIVEFDMVDPRFVEQIDILSELDSRPNLMDLNPFEFENLIGNLFKMMGFESKVTQSSKDGGIDVVAFDTRPVLGGKVVIQAKRYKNVVGVSSVRDLYGTMIDIGASKGILITTSHYGTDAYNFATNKPIELFDGNNLLYLLEQQRIKARIVMPTK